MNIRAKFFYSRDISVLSSVSHSPHFFHCPLCQNFHNTEKSKNYKHDNFSEVVKKASSWVNVQNDHFWIIHWHFQNLIKQYFVWHSSVMLHVSILHVDDSVVILNFDMSFTAMFKFFKWIELIWVRLIPLSNTSFLLSIAHSFLHYFCLASYFFLRLPRQYTICWFFMDLSFVNIISQDHIDDNLNFFNLLIIYQFTERPNMSIVFKI